MRSAIARLQFVKSDDNLRRAKAPRRYGIPTVYIGGDENRIIQRVVSWRSETSMTDRVETVEDFGSVKEEMQTRAVSHVCGNLIKAHIALEHEK